MPALRGARAAAPTWRDALFNRRMLICIFTGFSSGLPLYILINLLPAWLRSEAVDLKAIGLFALIQLPYTWKFLWSPLMDRYGLPLLGRRRGLDARDATAAARLDPAVRAPQPAPRHLDHRLPRRGGGAVLGQPGHRARRLPARDPARRRARARQRHPRQRLPDLEPRPRRAVADPRRPPAVDERVLGHRAVHAAGVADDAGGRRAAALARTGRRR